MTLYVESNFVLEILLGQEELAFAEALLAATERGLILTALPSFALNEPFSRITRSSRDRQALLRPLNAHVVQLGRSSPHQFEVGKLQEIPQLVTSIDRRESERLIDTVDRLLTRARIIELDGNSFRLATDFQTQFDLSIEDAIVLAVVVEDLKRNKSLKRHLFANRNRSDFGDPGIVAELNRHGCEIVWSFAEAARALGVP